MSKRRGLFFVLIGLAILVYAFNPFGTATPDPRAGIAGYVPYPITRESMKPTLQTNDQILVDTTAYAKKYPAINDIIVFKFPRNRNVDYVMRVVAKDGDTIIIKKGQVIVDGKVLDQRYVDEGNNAQTMKKDFGPLEVPPGRFFVLGDNRDDSNDSRYWGFVRPDDIVGKVEVIYMSDDEERIGEVK
jgi:signal peptidase I